MAKFAKRQKIAMYGVNNNIVPAQVCDIINVDDTKIETYRDQITTKYNNIINIANDLTRIAKAANDKKFEGKGQKSINNIRTYMSNQAKYWGEETRNLKNQINQTKKDLNTVVDSMSYVTQIDTILKGNVSDAERILLNRSKAADVRAMGAAGFTVGENNTVVSNGVSYTIKNGKLTKV